MSVENDFSQFLSRLKWKSPQKTEESQIFRDDPKSVLTTFFKRLFYVSFDIFIFTSRTTLILRKVSETPNEGIWNIKECVGKKKKIRVVRLVEINILKET